MRSQLVSECLNLDNNICIGNNTYITRETRRNTDPDAIAYFNFDNIYGIDMTISSSHHLKYDDKVLSKLIPSFNGNTLQT